MYPQHGTPIIKPGKVPVLNQIGQRRTTESGRSKCCTTTAGENSDGKTGTRKAGAQGCGNICDFSNNNRINQNQSFFISTRPFVQGMRQQIHQVSRTRSHTMHERSFPPIETACLPPLMKRKFVTLELWAPPLDLLLAPSTVGYAYTQTCCLSLVATSRDLSSSLSIALIDAPDDPITPMVDQVKGHDIVCHFAV